jgi:hypothetical protein
MNEKPSPQASQTHTQQEQVKAEKLRIARAFLEVFGSSKRRTSSQKLVLAHLSKDLDPEETNAFRFGGTDGISLIASGIHRDGAQTVLRMINRNVRDAEDESFQQEKPKPTVKR